MLENELSGVSHEVGLILAACVYRNPTLVMQTIGAPLLEKLQQSLTGAPERSTIGDSSTAKAKHEQMSPMLENSLVTQLELVFLLLPFCSVGSWQYKSQIMGIIRTAFRSTSAKVYDEASKIVVAIIAGLLTHYPLDEFRSIAASGVEVTALLSLSCRGPHRMLLT